jgi:hypothetical protein
MTNGSGSGRPKNTWVRNNVKHTQSTVPVLPVWGERREVERRWVDRSVPPGRSVRGGPADNTPPGSPEHKTTQLLWSFEQNLSGFAIVTGVASVFRIRNGSSGSGFLFVYQRFKNFGEKIDYLNKINVLLSIWQHIFFAVLQIRDILVWIRIRGSMLLTNGSGFGSGCGSFYFHNSSRCQQKTNLKKSFPAHYFLKVLLHHFSKIKSQKEVTKQ